VCVHVCTCTRRSFNLHVTWGSGPVSCFLETRNYFNCLCEVCNNKISEIQGRNMHSMCVHACMYHVYMYTSTCMYIHVYNILHMSICMYEIHNEQTFPWIGSWCKSTYLHTNTNTPAYIYTLNLCTRITQMVLNPSRYTCMHQLVNIQTHIHI